MSALQITLLVVGTIGVLLGVIFRKKNQQMSAGYRKRMSELNLQLETNTQQIFTRSEGLNTYDFLKYNLREALIIQSQIRL